MSELVFVTGASGYVGSHIVDQLLKAGYRVRAAARGQKAVALKKAYADVPKFEVVEINDITFDQFPDALKGVDAVIHAAASIPGKSDIDSMLNNSIETGLNVLRQAEKAGVRRFVVTSTIVTITAAAAERVITDKDWNPITKEDASASGSSFVAYAAAKKYSELAIWEWAESHPHVEVTTINPSWCYGPFVDRYPINPGDFGSFSTNISFYQLIIPKGKITVSPPYIDVRDVAKAHVKALISAPTSELGRKRIAFIAPYAYDFKDAIELISSKRPQLKERLIKGQSLPSGASLVNIDYERIEKVVGLKKDDFYTFEQTLLDSVDSILKIEEGWKAQGYVTEEIPSFP